MAKASPALRGIFARFQPHVPGPDNWDHAWKPLGGHVVTVVGHGLTALLDALADNWVSRLIQTTENEAKFQVRGDNATPYRGPAITKITVEETDQLQAVTVTCNTFYSLQNYLQNYLQWADEFTYNGLTIADKSICASLQISL
jgi:hypothetical protein